MINPGRFTAARDEDTVVFLIGMRINSLTRPDKWLPPMRAMTRMIGELYARPELGLLHHEMWFSRNLIFVQYWRSMDHLMAYAKSNSAAHLPAWKAFNQATKDNVHVGIWHETYTAKPGTYENIYVNMPAFGMGKAGMLGPISGQKNSARGRLSAIISETAAS